MAKKVKIIAFSLSFEAIEKAKEMAKKYHSVSALIQKLIISNYKNYTK
jgi:hypothetical protein